ncbi:hypothetical protein SRHO_G00127800 [Serrasalmus rhombeus]
MSDAAAAVQQVSSCGTRSDARARASKMSDNPVKQEVQNFDKKCLKKTNTAEKNTLPTQQDIEQEKKAAEAAK